MNMHEMVSEHLTAYIYIIIDTCIYSGFIMFKVFFLEFDLFLPCKLVNQATLLKTQHHLLLGPAVHIPKTGG